MFTSRLTILWVLITPMIISSCYYVWNNGGTPPLPNINLDEWWGEYPINMKPDKSIQPFQIEFPDVIIEDLKERLLHRRPFVPPLDNAGFSYGFNTNFLAQVLDFWQNSYNFKERVNYLNLYNQYVTNIQGLNIHYVHVDAEAVPNVEVIPILLIHNWPTSIREFYELIPMLTTHRENQKFVFEVIAPSLPGIGYSQAPSRQGMGPIAIAVILRNLMQRIGYNKYYVHGAGDFGHPIASVLATLFPDKVLGLHSSMPVILNQQAAFTTFMGSIWPPLLVKPEERERTYPLAKHLKTFIKESGFFHLQATKPDTIGIALSESPAGLASYILEKFSIWTNMDNSRASDGGLLNKFSLTHLLDNVMIYWMTNTITTSMRPFVEYYSDMILMDKIPTKVPTWGIKFKNEIRYTPDMLLTIKFSNYLQSTFVDGGGHFPALEMPKILADDIYDAVVTFRQFNEQKEGPKPPDNKPEPNSMKTVYDYTVKDIKGQEVNLEIYRGKVLIIVNVASQCGYTDTHYTQLNKLYEKYKQRGLRILAFPCNQFGGQEPGTLKDILQFTQKKKVKFDVFEKIEVNGDNTHPLWQFLKQTQKGTMGDFIKWNFSKFIIDRNGVPVERFGPNFNPLDLEPYLEKYL